AFKITNTGEILKELSVQQIVDCMYNPDGHDICQTGGTLPDAAKYVKQHGGLELETDYPYMGKWGTCHADVGKRQVTLTGYGEQYDGDEWYLREVVGTIGPVALGIFSDRPNFKLYKSGVYVDNGCHGVAADHGVVIVGYGRENNLDYWLIKNSWGGTWGDEGYIKVARNNNNQCGIGDNIRPYLSGRVTDFQRQSTGHLLHTVYTENKEYDVIIDFGCGSGYLTQLLAHKVKYRQIIAIDSDPTLVVEAQRRNTTDTIRYLHQDLDKPWAEWRPELRALESTANLIVSNIVFQAIEDKTRLMDVLAHLLASGGRVVARFGQTPDLNAKLTEHQRRKYRLFLKTYSTDQHYDHWSTAAHQKGLRVKQFAVFDNFRAITRQHMIAMSPMLPEMIASVFKLRNKTGVKYEFVKSIVFDVLTQPTTKHLSGNAWTDFVADDSIATIELHFQEIQLILDKP
ncbi:unnamed protein product, partial [Medioppia subpectinata]